MKRKRFSEAQIIGVLQEAEAGIKKQNSASLRFEDTCPGRESDHDREAASGCRE